MVRFDQWMQEDRTRYAWYHAKKRRQCWLEALALERCPLANKERRAEYLVVAGRSLGAGRSGTSESVVFCVGSADASRLQRGQDMQAIVFPGLMIDRAYREIGRGKAACRGYVPMVTACHLTNGF